jgi:hypothetical protein
MNRNAWITSQTRLGCAAVASLVCALVLSSVLWLFGGTDRLAASAATHQVLPWLFAGSDHRAASAAPRQVPVIADRRFDPERARAR